MPQNESTTEPTQGGDRPPLDVESGHTSAQLRRTGRIVLACGVVAAVLLYVMLSLGPPSDDDAFVHTRTSDNQMSRIMGHFGLIMADWQEWLRTPFARSLGVLTVSALLAGYFFRVASVEDTERRDREANG